MSRAALRRRDVVAGATLAAATMVLGLPRAARAQGSVDVEAVLGAVRLEYALAVGYTGLAARPRLGRDLRDLLGHFADHERQHAEALLSLAEFLGGPPPPVPTLAQVEQALPGVRTAVDRRSALTALDELERAEVLGFYAAQQVLGDAKLIELVGAVMCSDAQHLALVRQAAGLDPIPTAFETGQSR